MICFLDPPGGLAWCFCPLFLQKRGDRTMILNLIQAAGVDEFNSFVRQKLQASLRVWTWLSIPFVRTKIGPLSLLRHKDPADDALKLPCGILLLVLQNKQEPCFHD